MISNDSIPCDSVCYDKHSELERQENSELNEER